MDKTELDRGFEQALANLYQSKEYIRNKLNTNPDDFEGFDQNDFTELLMLCM